MRHSDGCDAPRKGRTLLLFLVLLLLPWSERPALAQEVALPEGKPSVIIKGSHMRMIFERDVRRVAVGDEKVMGHEPLSNRELLLLGKEVGRTSLIVWFDDGTLQHLVFSIERDLETLRSALRDIYPAIVAEIAPDRDAVVLRGVVPNKSYSIAAEAAARAYVTAEERNRSGDVNPLVASESAEDEKRQPRAPVAELAAGAVINLIRVEHLPPALEEQILDIISGLGGERVQIKRVVRGDLPVDETDVFVMSGVVRNQIDLIRVLSAAARVMFGDEEVADQIKVIADESGAQIAVEESGMSSTQGAVDDLLTAVLRASSGSGGFGTSGSSSGLFNLVGNNLARAKAVQLGDGRLLSFVEVEDLPQVRVDIRLYEVNRTRLRSFNPNLTLINSDFQQGAFLPGPRAVAVQGGNAAQVGSIGSTDVQNVMSFLADGFTNHLQIADGKLAIDMALNLMETEGIARTLARPSITVLSGELAAIQVGGTIPVQVAYAPAFGGSAEVIAPGVFTSIESLDFGVSLAVRPMVSDDGTITLDVVPRTLFPDADLTTSIRQTSGNVLPTTAFEGKSLRTTARLKDGQGMLIGGLVSKSSTNSASFMPWFQDVPLLGWLFQRFRLSDEEMDLVIVVNPTVIRDVCPEVSLWAFEDRAVMLGWYPEGDWVEVLPQGEVESEAEE
ncbi:MAG: pilus assembly protein N-terminal domain-containing protein [Planctomycetota bacterium]